MLGDHKQVGVLAEHGIDDDMSVFHGEPGVEAGWYTETLGLVQAFVEKHDNDAGYAVVLTRPGTSFFLGLDHHEDADRQTFDPRRTGLDHFALAVASSEEVHAWAGHLDSLGVEHEPALHSLDPVPSRWCSGPPAGSSRTSWSSAVVCTHVMLYAPRDEAEVAVALRIVQASYKFAATATAATDALITE